MTPSRVIGSDLISSNNDSQEKSGGESVIELEIDGVVVRVGRIGDAGVIAAAINASKAVP